VSAIASFILVPKSRLEGLRQAAVPKKRWLGKPRDVYCDYLKQHGREVAAYRWSGYVFATLLPFFQDQQVDLMDSEFNELATQLTEARGATHFILTDGHKRAHLGRLTPDCFPEDQLRDYYNEFNGADEPESGKPMLDGIRAIVQALRSVDEGFVVVCIIG